MCIWEGSSELVGAGLRRVSQHAGLSLVGGSRSTCAVQRRKMIELALLPEPRPKARNLPTRYGARDVGAQANRIRL
jgi:hypothetical protein